MQRHRVIAHLGDSWAGGEKGPGYAGMVAAEPVTLPALPGWSWSGTWKWIGYTKVMLPPLWS